MARTRASTDLPIRVEFHHGAYRYRPRHGIHIRLGVEKLEAIEMFKAVGDPQDVARWCAARNEVRRLRIAGGPEKVGGIPATWLGAIYRKARANAIARKLPFLLSIEDVHAIAQRAVAKCEVSGIDFSYELVRGRSRIRSRMIWAPSLDRIDSTRGYTPNNVRLVCAAVNIALSDWGLDVLRKIADGLGTTDQKDEQNQCAKTKESAVSSPPLSVKM